MNGIYNKVIFISEVRNPKTKASSTQIMTDNILYGFREICKELIFVPVLSNPKDKDIIEEKYSCLCNKVIVTKGNTKHGSNRVLSKLSMTFACLKSPKSYIPKEIEPYLTEDAIIVSHSPNIDSALICAGIKKKYPFIRYVQYWGDPLALSLITPEQYSWKRCIQKKVETYLHQFPDKIVYGTQSLYQAQIKLFPKIQNKAVSVEVSFKPNTEERNKQRPRPLIGYFGNYFSNIRDLFPFYEAARELPDCDFVICGNGDVVLQPTENIKILKRVSIDEVGKMESELDVDVCLLNKVGIQVPGKIFYMTNTSKIIFVILDGPVKETIKAELEISNRFVFCDNDKESIKQTLIKELQNKCKNTYNVSIYSPEVIGRNIIELSGNEKEQT